MVRAAHAAIHQILLAAGIVSGIAIGIQALHSMARAALFAVAGTSIAAVFLNMQAAGSPAATLISAGVIAYGQRPSPPRAVER